MGARAFPTNVLLLGKTGVGKSSLLNYLFGENQAETGVGRPVTGEGIFRHPTFPFHDMEITLHDSWGLEPDKGARWREIIEDEVRKHDTKDIRDWFHTIIYCIDAQRSRIDDFELDIIQSLADSGNRLVFALTRADIAKPQEIDAIHKVLGRWDFSRVPVCSVGRQLVGGRVTKQEGKEDLLRAICKNLSENLFSKALERYLRDLGPALAGARSRVLAEFEEKAGPLGFFTSYGDEFRKCMETCMERSYGGALEKAKKDLLKLLDDLAKMESVAHLNLQGHTEHLKTRFDVRAESPRLEKTTTWDNSFASNLAEVVTSLLFAPLMPFMRKSLYRDDLGAACDAVGGKILSQQREKIRELRGASVLDGTFTLAGLVAR